MARSVLSKFLHLPSDERAVLLRAIWLVGLARVTLRLMDFASVRRLATPRPGGGVDARVTPGRVHWAIAQAQRVIPDATCLPQAVAAEALLVRGGRPVLLRIGVRKLPNGRILAHAWVECDRRIIVGDLPELHEEYAHLPPLPAAWPESSGETRARNSTAGDSRA